MCVSELALHPSCYGSFRISNIFDSSVVEILPTFFRQTGKHHKIHGVPLTLSALTLIITEEEDLFLQCDCDAQLNHNTLIWWCPIQNSKYRVRAYNIVHIILTDIVSPSRLCKIDLVVALEWFPHLGTKRLECVNEVRHQFLIPLRGKAVR